MELKDIFKQHATAVEGRLEELGVDTGTLKAQLAELEQKMVRATAGGGPAAHESWGQRFVEAEGLKAFAEEHSRPGRFRMEIKDTLTTTGGAGFLQPAIGEPSVSPRRSVRVRDLLPTIQIGNGSVEYPKQTTRTNNAAPAAEGTAKAESAYAFTLETAVARVIAHWVPASRQVLDDAPQLRDIIDQELLYGLQLKEDDQLLYGDGTGDNLDGLVTNATAYSAPFDPAGTETEIDKVALGMLQAALGDFQPNGIVIHPSDWMRIRLLKDADGKYLLGEPRAQVEPRLFGVPVVATPAMTIDKFLVGDFQAAATLYDRWTPRVEVSTEHSDFFTKNLVAILAEERVALAVKQAGALIYGDFGNVA